MSIPTILADNHKWGDHYKYWLEYFNQSKNILLDLLKFASEIEDSTLNQYYINLNNAKGLIHTNPLSFALATCDQLDVIIEMVKAKDDFKDIFYNMIYTVFHDCAFHIISNNPKLRIDSKLFDIYKEWIDWFGIFFSFRSSRYDLIEYETEIYQKYYEFIFGFGEGRPDTVAGFWRAIMLGVEIPIDYVYNSVLENNTTFAQDKYNLFYKPILTYWGTNELEDFLKNPITPNSTANIEKYMNQMRTKKELYVLINLR